MLQYNTVHAVCCVVAAFLSRGWVDSQAHSLSNYQSAPVTDKYSVWQEGLFHFCPQAANLDTLHLKGSPGNSSLGFHFRFNPLDTRIIVKCSGFRYLLPLTGHKVKPSICS